MLTQNSQLGVGGAGMQGREPGSANAIIKELQGLNVSLLTGASGGSKINLAAIRPEDTILTVLNNNAGTISDVSFVQGVKASGTLTFASAVANDTFVVNGVTFTIKTSPVTGVYTDVGVGTSDTNQAVKAAAAINAFFGDTDNSVTATSALGVVTITATSSGTGPNSYTTVGGARITAGAATLANGTADSGCTISPVTASGTLTFAAAVADDTFVVNGVTFTIKATPVGILQSKLGTSNRLTASNAAKAINAYFANKDNSVVATVLNNVVTVRATAEGTAPNSYTLVGGTHITASAATLANGTTTGGVSVVATTQQLIVFWFNKA